MTIKKMTTIPNNFGKTEINSKFTFSNKKLLTSIANLNQNTVEATKSIKKIVDSESDKSRTNVFSSSVLNNIKKANIKLPKIDDLTIKPSSSLGIPENLFRPFSPIAKPILTPVSGIRPTSLSGATPISIDTSVEIAVYSRIYDSERSIFRSGSFLNAASLIDEKIIGKRPKKEETPKVLGIIEEEVKNGYPKCNVVFFKKFKSDTGYATKYTIHRKDIFREFFFKKIAILDPSTLAVPIEYQEFIQELGFNIEDVFIIKDFLIRNDAVYVYKLETDWIFSLSTLPTKEFATGSLSRFVEIGSERIDFNEQLFGKFTLETSSSVSPSGSLFRFGRI